MHPPLLAGTRLRLEQYRAHIERAGLRFELCTFLDADDLDAWYGTSHAARTAVLLRAMLRLPFRIAPFLRAQVVIVQGEMMPVGPPVVEWLLKRKAPLVWDVDDAIWQSSGSITAGRLAQCFRGSRRKSRWLARSATEVWAGSEVLARWCRQHSQNVHVVPTVVGTPNFSPGEPGRVVGWVGSHSTGPFLERVLPAVGQVEPPAKVMVVGAEVAIPSGLEASVQAWTPASEADLLRQTRVGLYPLDRSHALAEGKCALKAVMYMAHGIPCVVTPTTTNRAVVRDGIDGFYADSNDEWCSRVQQLLGDDRLWLRMSRAARARARAEFSLDRWGPWVAERLARLVHKSDIPSAPCP